MIGQTKGVASKEGNLFTAHPASVGESYGEHARFAAGFSLRLFGAALAALVHAVLPFCFEKTAGKAVMAMAEEMAARNRT